MESSFQTAAPKELLETNYDRANVEIFWFMDLVDSSSEKGRGEGGGRREPTAFKHLINKSILTTKVT